MPILHLDFETRSTVDLKKAGVYNYSRHPTTDVWCCAWAVDDDPVRLWWAGEPVPGLLRDALRDERVTVAGHNVGFEWHIIEYICAPRYGWPSVAPERLDCTAARAAVQSLPRDLAGAAKALGLPIEKDSEGRSLMLRMAKPRKVHDDGSLEWWDVPERKQRLGEYCVRDVEVERALDQVLLPLTDSERKIWLMDFTINHRGVAVDTELVAKAEQVLTHSLKQYGKRLSALTDGQVTTVTNNGALRKWLNDNGIDTDSVGKEAIAAIAQAENLPDNVRDVLQIRQEAAKTSTSKLKMFEIRTSADGRMRDNLMYHGAGTGRWTAKGVQLQNLPRPSISHPDVMLAIDIIKDPGLSVADKVEQIEFLVGPVPTVISDCLRSMLIADEGCQLDVADYANIEGRVNAWGAGQDDKVEVFRTGGKIYERMAAAIFGITEAEVTKDGQERFLGKTAELGCGYGMGAPKFVDTCAKQGADIPLELAERTIETYRDVNNRIKAFWYGLEEAAVDAMRTPGVWFQYRDVHYILPTRDMPGFGFLLCRLPSGRCLFYPGPQLKKVTTPWGAVKDQITYLGVNQQTRKWERQKTYGGKLVENAVQATARDLMAAAMYRLEKAGYRIVLTVHDEIVAESPKGFGSLKEFERLMAKTPKWAAGCPVAVEGYRADRYKK